MKPKPMAKKVEPPVAPPGSELYLVYFDFDKVELSEAAKAVLETASSAAWKLKGMTVTVSGHTDLAGTADHNMELSKRRAMAVSEALIKAGVASAAVKAGLRRDTSSHHNSRWCRRIWQPSRRDLDRREITLTVYAVWVPPNW